MLSCLHHPSMTVKDKPLSPPHLWNHSDHSWFSSLLQPPRLSDLYHWASLGFHFTKKKSFLLSENQYFQQLFGLWGWTEYLSQFSASACSCMLPQQLRKPPRKSVDDTDGSWLTSSPSHCFYLTVFTKRSFSQSAAVCGSYGESIGTETEHFSPT